MNEEILKKHLCKERVVLKQGNLLPIYMIHKGNVLAHSGDKESKRLQLRNTALRFKVHQRSIQIGFIEMRYAGSVLAQKSGGTAFLHGDKAISCWHNVSPTFEEALGQLPWEEQALKCLENFDGLSFPSVSMSLDENCNADIFEVAETEDLVVDKHFARKRYELIVQLAEENKIDQYCQDPEHPTDKIVLPLDIVSFSLPAAEDQGAQFAPCAEVSPRPGAMAIMGFPGSLAEEKGMKHLKYRKTPGVDLNSFVCTERWKSFSSGMMRCCEGPVVSYEASTLPGHSGSPVFLEDGLCAVHSIGRPDSDELSYNYNLGISLTSEGARRLLN